MPSTISPVRKEKPASQFRVLRRNIFNLNFNLDMFICNSGARSQQISRQTNSPAWMSDFTCKKKNLRNIFSTFVDY